MADYIFVRFLSALSAFLYIVILDLIVELCVLQLVCHTFLWGVGGV